MPLPRPWHSRIQHSWLVLVGLIGSLGFAPLIPKAFARAPSALMLLDSAQLPGSRLAEVASEQVSRVYRIVYPEASLGLSEYLEDCDRERREDLQKALLQDLERASDFFFSHADVERATVLLTSALRRIGEEPCLLMERPTICPAQGLLVRLLLLQDRKKEASLQAQKTAVLCGPFDMAKTNEPPEVLDLIEKARSRCTNEVRVEVRGDSGEGRLFVGGVEVPKGLPMVLSLPEGTYPLVYVDSKGKVFRKEVEAREALTVFDVALSRLLRQGPQGTLVLTPLAKGREFEVASKVASLFRGAVVLLRSQGDGSLMVEAFEGEAGGARHLMSLRPLEEGVEVRVEPQGPFLSRPSWPWPYVTGGLALGLLGAGIYLNVLANRDAGAISDGTNRLSDYRIHRRWAIGCYSGASAMGVATALLFLFRPDLKDRFIVFDTDGFRLLATF